MEKEFQVWIKYLQSRGEDPEKTAIKYVFAEHFCNDKESANKLYDLVILGKKRATCGNLLMYQFKKEPILHKDDLTVLTNFDQTKACILRTKKVIVKKFGEITEEDARKEGEGDLSLEHWKRVHGKIFESECAKLGKEFSEDIEVVFEEFDVEYQDEDY